MTSSRKKFLFIIPILAAVLVVVLLVKTKSSPQLKKTAEISRVMRVIEVLNTEIVPRTTGYGISEPAQIWQAIAEVRGRVTEINPDLKAGALLLRSAIILTIDQTEYELSIASAKATIEEIKSNFQELIVQKENAGHSLIIENRSLLLAEQSLERKQKALNNTSVSANEVDQEERNVLLQRQRVQDLENTLNLIPSRKKALEAKLAVSESALKQAQLDLAKTIVKAPFDCRIGSVNIQPGQYLNTGQTLFEAHGTSVTEIEAQVLGEHLRHLIGVQNELEMRMSMYTEVTRRLANIKAVVRLRSGNWDIVWDARVDRLRETVDPDTRAYNVVVAVDRPYEKIIPGKRPPLSRGLFCEVELSGPLRKALVIPRTSLHGNTVYILDKENRLQPRTVTTVFSQSNLTVIDSGLLGGETLVVSDPAPAIHGLLVSPVWDDQLQFKLVAEARTGTVSQ